jgi:hypothetical protein
MNKIIASIRRISGFLVTSIVILFVGYFVFLRYFQSFLPLPVFIEAKRIYMNILAIGFFALIPISLVINYPIIIRTVLSMLVILSCCVFSYLSIDIPERILTSTEFNNHQYHITVEGDFDQNFVTYIVYKCDVDNFKCQELYSDYSSSIDSVDFVVDEKLNELHYIHYTMFNRIMKYTDGLQPRQILASEEYKGFIYNVTIPSVDVYPIYGSSSEQYAYFLYRCSTSYKECQKLPFSYSDTGGDIWLIINEDTNELEMYNWQSDTHDVLIFTYGDKPKCHVEQCSYQDE